MDGPVMNAALLKPIGDYQRDGKGGGAGGTVALSVAERGTAL